jgi:Copper type II ascorbate-dependent monooxygenase, C-terminal domain
MKNFWRISRGLCVLGVGLGVLGAISNAPQWGMAVSRVQAVVLDAPRHQGHFVNQNIGDVPWTLAPAYAQSGGKTVGYQLAEYAPNNEKGGLDDYHCFLIDPKIAADTFVTGVKVNPDNGRLVHHAILFRVEPEVVPEALERNKGGKGWTCFGGTGLGMGGGGLAANLENPGVRSGAWVGAWVPGLGKSNMPEGVGVPIKKGSMLVMQMHYNLANGLGSDRSSFELTYAPEGAKLQSIRNQNLIAPVELPCPEALQNTPACKRDNTLQKNAEEVGAMGRLLPPVLLALCNQRLDTTQKVGDASSIRTSCDRKLGSDATLYSVAGHMHLLGKQIKVELVNSSGSTTLLNIPKWDFHWQGNYWFKDPVKAKKGDTLRVSCVFDNSSQNRPYVGSNPLEMRYITWGEGTADEMCLGVVNLVAQ